MSITGIFGNLSVCCVILRFPGMRSATNYYLFSLAVADLLILLLGESVSAAAARWRSVNGIDKHLVHGGSEQVEQIMADNHLSPLSSLAKYVPHKLSFASRGQTKD